MRRSNLVDANEGACTFEMVSLCSSTVCQALCRAWNLEHLADQLGREAKGQVAITALDTQGNLAPCQLSNTSRSSAVLMAVHAEATCPMRPCAGPSFEQLHVRIKSTSGGGLGSKLNLGEQTVLCGSHMCKHCSHCCPGLQAAWADEVKPSPDVIMLSLFVTTFVCQALCHAAL